MGGRAGDRDLDVAVIGGGASGTAVARALQQTRPDISITLFERTDRIGGRLRSVRIDGLDHPIELGGMRFLTSHPRVASLVDSLGLATHQFDPTGGAAERSYLRGYVSTGADGTDAGRGYDLRPDQRGKSAHDLAAVAFGRIVPGFERLDHPGHVRWRATGRFLDRPVTDWSSGDLLEAVLGGEGRRFVNDAFGYDSGMRAFCAPDFVEFLFDGGDPAAAARVPDDGMDRIPRELAARFEAARGEVLFDHELGSIEVEGDGVVLRFANGKTVHAATVVLTTPVPALRLLAQESMALRTTAFGRVLASVEPFAAMKLYLWFERPWWRPAVAGIRTTTDLPIRKVIYFDGEAGSRSALLGMYTDGLDIRPWAALYEGAPAGAPAPQRMLDEVLRQLAEVHPGLGQIPRPISSALMYWGADPHEVGWHFWRAGVNSDSVLTQAPQPEPSLPIYLANEAFSRRQSWVEGALEAADAVVERLQTDRRRADRDGSRVEPAT